MDDDKAGKLAENWIKTNPMICGPETWNFYMTFSDWLDCYSYFAGLPDPNTLNLAEKIELVKPFARRHLENHKPLKSK